MVLRPTVDQVTEVSGYTTTLSFEDGLLDTFGWDPVSEKLTDIYSNLIKELTYQMEKFVSIDDY